MSISETQGKHHWKWKRETSSPLVLRTGVVALCPSVFIMWVPNHQPLPSWAVLHKLTSWISTFEVYLSGLLFSALSEVSTFPSIPHRQNHSVPPSAVQQLIHFNMWFAFHFLSRKVHPTQMQPLHFDSTERIRCDTLLPWKASFQSLLGFLHS